MPDPALSAALKEAYASSPVDLVIYHTLEIWHPIFAVPIRVVCDRDALDARIEAGAARDAGAIVTFAAYAFDIVPPEQTATAVPGCTIEIDNVSREIGVQIDLAATQDTPTIVIYRQYLSDSLTVGPENLPPLEMTILTCTVSVFRIRATVGFPDLLNRKFPRMDYDLTTFPGLIP